MLVRRLLARSAQFECERVSSARVRTHQKPGREGGYVKRILAWIRYATNRNFDAIVLVVDEDGQRKRIDEFNLAQSDERVALPRAIGVAIRTFDAWMLADERALSNCLGDPVNRQRNPETIRNPKQVCVEILKERSKLISQSELYAAVAADLDLQALERRCPAGFAPFAARVRCL